MNRENFNPDWPHGHETVSGHPATIIKRDLRGEYPLVVVVDNGDEEEVETYSEDGTYLFGSPDSGMNLRNKVPG